MIIFHEGLPGSGKSYEAAINQIIPALKKNRKVYAYIEGLNRVKFAQVTGLTLDQVTELLIPIEKEKVTTIQDHVENDSLVVIDELQDFFPTSKNQLDTGITEFITQHRHRGIDIVCMGQDHRDCHMLWKRRIDTLITFVKRDAVGMPNAYTWSTHKQTGGKFVKLRSGKGTYDSKYFGLYASHSDGVNSIDAHVDDRTNVFKSSVFKFWIPVFALLMIYAIYYLYGYLHGSSSKIVETTKIETKPLTPKPVSKSFDPQPTPPKETPTTPETPKTVAVEYAEFIERYLKEYRPRLAAMLVSKKTQRVFAKIDFYDNERRVHDSFNIVQMQDFGYTVEVKSFGLLLSKNGKQYPVTAWPLDIDRNVSEYDKPALQSKPQENNDTYRPMFPTYAQNNEPDPIPITTPSQDHKQIVKDLHKIPDFE